MLAGTTRALNRHSDQTIQFVDQVFHGTLGKNQTLPIRPASLPDARRSVDRCREYRASRDSPERREVARNEAQELLRFAQLNANASGALSSCNSPQPIKICRSRQLVLLSSDFLRLEGCKRYFWFQKDNYSLDRLGGCF